VAVFIHPAFAAESRKVARAKPASPSGAGSAAGVVVTVTSRSSVLTLK
jgi:hypothetical protein